MFAPAKIYKLNSVAFSNTPPIEISLKLATMIDFLFRIVIFVVGTQVLIWKASYLLRDL